MRKIPYQSDNFRKQFFNFVFHTPLHSRFTPSQSYYFFTLNFEEKSFEIENNSIDFDFFQALKSFLAAADLLIHLCIHASNFGKWHFHMFPASILKKKGLCMSKSYNNYVFIWIKCHSPMTISCWIVKSQRPFPQAISMAKWEFSFILKFHSSEIKGFCFSFCLGPSTSKSSIPLDYRY